MKKKEIEAILAFPEQERRNMRDVRISDGLGLIPPEFVNKKLTFKRMDKLKRAIESAYSSGGQAAASSIYWCLKTFLEGNRQ